jgi:hypothetical protein
VLFLSFILVEIPFFIFFPIFYLKGENKGTTQKGKENSVGDVLIDRPGHISLRPCQGYSAPWKKKTTRNAENRMATAVIT